MSTYMNRCPRCGCTDETRIMRREYDEMKDIAHRLLAYAIQFGRSDHTLSNLARSAIIADCEQMGMHIPRRPKNDD